MELLGEHRCFSGRQQRWRHHSLVLDCVMTLSVFLPPEHETPPPVLYWLSGLTCNDKSFTTKVDTQRITVELGIALAMPDTNPHSDEIANDDGHDLGQGTGSYLNATEALRAVHYRMYDCLYDELSALIRNELSVGGHCTIGDHSMGDHDTLVVAPKNPSHYAGISAFTPIVNPGQVLWGKKVFTAYLGADESTWQPWDSYVLIQASQPADAVPTLINQDDNDPFLAKQLQPAVLAEIVRRRAQPLTLRIQSDYDHSYHFITSPIEDHLCFHTQHLFA